MLGVRPNNKAIKMIIVTLDHSFTDQLTEIHPTNHKSGFKFKARIIPRFLDLKNPPALPIPLNEYVSLEYEEKQVANNRWAGKERRIGKFRDKLNVFMSHPVHAGMTCQLRPVGGKKGSIYLHQIDAVPNATLILTASLSGKDCERTIQHSVSENVIIHKFHRETGTGIHWNNYYVAAIPIGHNFDEYVSTHDTGNRVVKFNFERVTA